MYYQPMLNEEEYRRQRKPALTNLCFTGLIIGCGLLMYPILSNLFVKVISSSENLYYLYSNSIEFRSACECIYTMVCVFLPFMICLVMFRASRTYNEELPLGKSYSLPDSALLIVFGFGMCFIANYAVSYLCRFYEASGIEYYSASYEQDMPETVSAALMMYLSTALVPALFEEFAFRGVVLQSLRRYGDWFAIGVSSVLFALMHGNAVQVPFALIVGLALGYISVVSGSLWPGIIVHFLNNSFSVTYYVVVMNTDVVTANRFYSFVTAFIAFAGIACFAVFMIFNGNVSALRRNTEPLLPKRLRYIILMPTMFAGVVYLIYRTLTDFVVFSEFVQRIFNG